jgi:hypothetical protein
VTDERIIAYLLGELPGEDSERFEDDCFELEDWPDQLNQVEGDLIEDYLRGDLTPERRRLFERNYLRTAARMERVRVAAALLRHVDALGPAKGAAEKEAARESEGDAGPSGVEKSGGWFSAFWSPRGWAQGAALAMVALALVAGAWWVSRTGPGRAVATLTLSAASADRAEGSRPGRVKLTPETGVLRVSLILPEGRPPGARYRVELEEEGGGSRALGVKGRDGRSVTVEIPASQLARRQYSLRLFAAGADGAELRVPGSYLFMVE